MRNLLVICFCLSTLLIKAQDKAITYINTYKDVAIAEMHRTGVPAAITLAQGLIESGCGEGDLCKLSNNHFGIKCKTDWTGGTVYHDDDAKQECFRSYLSGEDSYKDHSDFLKTREPYAFLFKIEPLDYSGWAYGLKKAGYATEKDYPQKLIKVINDFNLNQFTLWALNNKPAEVFTDSSVIASANKIDSTINTDTVAFELVKPSKKSKLMANSETANSFKETIAKDTVQKELIIPAVNHNNSLASAASKPIFTNEDSVAIINNNFTALKAKDTANVNYPSGVFAINHSKVIYVEEGVSLLSLAKQHDIALSKLLEYNDMGEVDITPKAQLVYLERKQLKGNTDTHIVKPNESLLDISQQEGVRYDKLLEYNKIKKENNVKAGDKILLRPIVTYGLSK